MSAFDLGQIDVPVLYGDSTSVERARQQFLEAAALYEPEVLRTLRTGPYQMALDTGGDVRSFAEPSTPESLKLTEATKKWAADWNLGDWWCSSTAHSTVSSWLMDGERADFSRWAFPWVHSGITIQMTPEPQGFSFEATWFDWTVESGAFARQTEARFKKELRKFIEKIIALRKEQGLRAPVKKREEEHFYWLARYQIGSASFAEIYRGVTEDRVVPRVGRKGKRLSPEAIQMAITRLSKLIGLTLRTAESVTRKD